MKAIERIWREMCQRLLQGIKQCKISTLKGRTREILRSIQDSLGREIENFGPKFKHQVSGIKTTKSNRLASRPCDQSAIEAWFDARGWDVLPHQRAAWTAIAGGESGLVILPTGAGKTYSVFLGFLPELDPSHDHLCLLYITPLKALTRDIEKSLANALEDLAPQLRLETRTGDSKSSQRKRQKKRLPHVLVTTPESLALLLTSDDTAERFANLRGIIVDEWHDLIGGKRGSLLELNLAQLRSVCPKLRIWGLSATLANPQQAARALCGLRRNFTIITSPTHRALHFRTFLPTGQKSLPWA